MTATVTSVKENAIPQGGTRCRFCKGTGFYMPGAETTKNGKSRGTIIGRCRKCGGRGYVSRDERGQA